MQTRTRERRPAPRAAPRRRAGWIAAEVRRFTGHWPVLLPGVGALAYGSTAVAAGWFAASRLAYVLFVAATLRAAEGRVDLPGRSAAWFRFRARASWFMDNDAVAFVALCLVTAGRLPTAIPVWASLGGGILLALLGIGTKSWAVASLPAGSYHWRNFFVAPEPGAARAAGPYRWLSDPMYTVGYAHAYGAALALRSPAGLLAAVAAQASILLLHALVERPHLQRLRAAR